MTTTTVKRHIRAERSAVYRALLDANAVESWMVPDGMTSQIHAFEAREGGFFRISLTYEEASGAGKTTAHTDTYHGHFAKLIENQRVVQVIEFESEDDAMRGEMTVTMTLEDVAGGTELVATHEHLPAGVAAADNELGWNMSLSKLAALVEG